MRNNVSKKQKENFKRNFENFGWAVDFENGIGIDLQ